MASHFHFDLSMLVFALLFASMDGIWSLVRAAREPKRRPLKSLLWIGADAFLLTGIVVALTEGMVSFVSSFFPTGPYGTDAWSVPGMIFVGVLLALVIVSRCIRHAKGIPSVYPW